MSGYASYAAGSGDFNYYNGTQYTFYQGPKYFAPNESNFGTVYHGPSYVGAEYSVKLGDGAYANFAGPVYGGSYYHSAFYSDTLGYINSTYRASHYSAATYFYAYTPFGTLSDYIGYYYSGSIYGYNGSYYAYYGNYYGGYSTYGGAYPGQGYGSYYAYGYPVYGYAGH